MQITLMSQNSAHFPTLIGSHRLLWLKFPPHSPEHACDTVRKRKTFSSQIGVRKSAPGCPQLYQSATAIEGGSMAAAAAGRSLSSVEDVVI